MEEKQTFVEKYLFGTLYVFIIVAVLSICAFFYFTSDSYVLQMEEEERKELNAHNYLSLGTEERNDTNSKISFRTDGKIVVNADENSFALCGTFGRTQRCVHSSQYNWTWQTIRRGNDIITSGNNNNNAFNVTAYISKPIGSSEIKYYYVVENNLQNITGFQFWFINKLEKNQSFEYNNTVYHTSRLNEVNIKNLSLNDSRQIIYKDYYFVFSDLIEIENTTGYTNFDNDDPVRRKNYNVDLKFGNGSALGIPEDIVGIGVTTPLKSFSKDSKFIFDPTITDEFYPAAIGSAPPNWLFPNNMADACDNSRAVQSIPNTGDDITQGSYNISDNLDLNPDEQITINGILMTMEASATNSCTVGKTSVTPTVVLGMNLSWDNGPSRTETRTQTWTCSNEVAKTFGSLSDTWGRTWTVDELDNLNFSTQFRINSFSDSGKARIDCLSIQVNFTKTLGNPPKVDLVAPENDSTFFDNTSMDLIWTVNDSEDNSYTTVVFGGKNSSILNQTILYRKQANHSTAKNHTYNWTAQTVDPNSEGLQLLYHFDNNSLFPEADDVIHDFGPNDINNTDLNNPIANETLGKFGGSIFLNSSGPVDKVIQIGSHSSLKNIASNGNMTVCGWFSTLTVDNNGPWKRWSLTGDDMFWRFSIQAFDPINNDSEVQITSNGTASGDSLCTLDTKTNFQDFSDGEFHQHCFTFSDGNLSIYADGEIYNSTMCSFSSVNSSLWNSSSEQTRIGGGNRPISKGNVDEFAMWNRTLSPNEIYNMSILNEGSYYWDVNVSEVEEPFNSSSNGTNVFHINISAAAPGDTCTYTSGNWDVDCLDHCNVTSNVVIDDGANVTCSGAGTFNVIGGNISGYNRFITINPCFAKIEGSQLFPV